MERRTFLKSTAAGAFVLGFDACAFAPTGGTIFRHHQQTGEFQPNAWLRILPDNTIIFTLDRVEMGQGTTTSHAALVAEELEVDPKQLKIVYAEAARAYDNPDKQINIQITGGSTSTKASWTPLREAGAVAREMLRSAAAARWGVAVRECTARDAAIHSAKGSLSYGELAGDAAKQDVPHVALKQPKDWKLIGTSIDRLDIAGKVDGSGVYGLDVKLPNMVTAVLIRPPMRGGKLHSFDATKAKQRRGVFDVVRIGNAVAVAATGYWEARTAADLVEVGWDGGHADTIDSDQLFASFHALAQGEGTVIARDDGEYAKHLGQGAVDPARHASLDVEYRTPYLAHATMEPQNATAWLHGKRCEVWAPTQAAGIAQWRVAEAIGFNIDDVAIHTTLIGGGFGRRGLVDYCVEAALVAQKLGRPTKVVFSREDDQANDWYRPMTVSRLRGAVANGKLDAWYQHVVAQSILEDEGGDFVGALLPNAMPRGVRHFASTFAPGLFARGTMADSTATEGAHDLPYAIPNLRVEHTPVRTGIPVGFWRSVGHSHTGFSTESFFDELCALGKLDPFEARRALLAKHPRHKAVLELAAQKAGWGTPLPAGVGRGIAVHMSFNTYCAQVIEASVTGGRVKVHRVVVAFDCGRVVNPALVAQQAESAVIFGLSAALKQQITLKRGRVQETNFNAYKALRMFECPPIETYLVPSQEPPSGVGEPGLPPVAPALANAIFAATGKRIRTLPLEPELAKS